MPDDISIHLIMASRGRSEEAKKAMESAVATAENPDRVKICLRVDADDPVEYDYNRFDYFMRGPRMGGTQAFNEMATWVPGDISFTLADDIRFRTKGWDKVFSEAYDFFRGEPFAFYTNDLHATPAKATHLGVSRAWIKLFGNLWTPKLQHFYADTWVQDVAMRAHKLAYLQDVITEHLHPKYGKGKWDATYEDTRMQSKMERDHLFFEASLTEREEWAQQIRDWRS